MPILLLLLLLVMPLAAQIPQPQVKTTGTIGTGGPFFPFFNNGTINMTSNSYTMVYPDQSASIIRVTGTLTAAGTIIAPQAMGFEFVIINATTGGFPITLQGTGTGVSVPNNSAVMVVSDGTNYIQVGSAGGAAGPIVSPLVVPSADGTNNLTITVPNSGGGNPVLSSSTGTINIASLFVTNLAGHGVSCLQSDNTGAVTATGTPCGSAAGGLVPWSSLTAPTTNLIFSMDTHATVWDFNLYGTGTPADPGVGFIFEDFSASNPPPAAGFSDTRDLMFLWAQQPNTSPLEILVSTVPGVSSCTVSPPSCGGFKIDGATGNIQMEGNAGIQIPGTTGVVSAGNITSDTAMNSPVYNVCTAANPCITPAIAPLNSARKGGKQLQAGSAPTGRLAGGEPLSSTHLHDFSTTPPTNGQVPIFDSASGKYVPGLMTGGPGGGGAPSFPVKPFPAGATYNVTTGDFAACTTLYASGTVTRTAQLPSPAPALGQCIWIINASSGNVVVGHSPETINGTAFAPTINGTTGPITANSVKVTSDGTNYVMARFPGTPSFLGSTAWSSITDPSNYLYLHMLNNQTTFNYDWTGSGGSGGTIGILLSDVGVQSSPSYQNIPRTMFKIASKHNDVSPMEVASLNGGFTVDATNGNLAMKPTSKLVGNLQLPITSATSLATDTSGNIIAGTGGGGGPATSLPINALTDATGEGLVNLGLHNIWWSWNSTGSGGGTGGGITFADSMIDEGQYPGGAVVSIYNQGVERNLLDVSSGASPYKGWLVDGYGDLSSQNGATLSAPLRLVTSDATGNPVANAASLGTDANGNIVPSSSNVPVYSRIHHLSLQTTSIYFSPPNSPECVPASSSCTMLTPAQDGVYRFTWQIVQTAPGSPASGGNGPCNAGTLTFFIGWVDPDTNVNMQAYAQGRGMNAGALTSSFVMASAANASGLAWIAIPMEFRAKGGSPIQFRFYQSVASNCDTPPQFVFRPRLYGPLPE